MVQPNSSSTEVEMAASRVIAALERDFNSLPTETLQQLMTVLVKAYAGRMIDAESFGEGPPSGISPFIANAPVTATEVMVTVSEMLNAVRLNLFELGMWQHIGRFQARPEESPEPSATHSPNTPMKGRKNDV